MPVPPPHPHPKEVKVGKELVERKEEVSCGGREVRGAKGCTRHNTLYTHKKFSKIKELILRKEVSK